MAVLLDYVFKVSAITPTPAASTSFLKKVLVLVKPKSGVTPGTIATCTTSGQIAAQTDNTDAVELLNAGMSSIFVLPMATLDIEDEIAANLNDFYTILVSSDFNETEFEARDFGGFTGVVGVWTDDAAKAKTYGAIENVCAFFGTTANKAENMFYAFGKLLSNALNWNNQQYITMPNSDDISALGTADGYFDDKISFVISDSQYGNRLALFCCGGKSIVQPYITKNLSIDMQSKALTYISGNQPQYTNREAALLENSLKDVIDLYIGRLWIEAATIEITLEQANFVASGNINMTEPKALWRVFAELRQTF